MTKKLLGQLLQLAIFDVWRQSFSPAYDLHEPLRFNKNAIYIKMFLGDVFKPLPCYQIDGSVHLQLPLNRRSFWTDLQYNGIQGLRKRNRSTNECFSCCFGFNALEPAWPSGQGARLEIWRPRVQAKLWSLAGFVPGSHWLNSSAALVYSQLVWLPPVEILNLLHLFQKVECLWTSFRAKCTFHYK